MDESNDLAKQAHELGLGDVSMYVWQICCLKHGAGGTPESNQMYEKIMRVVVDEWTLVSGAKLDAYWEQFYAAYPRKVARPAALRAWKRVKMTPEVFERIMKALEAAKRSEQWVKDKGKFIPYPATWLNQERWNDEVELPGNQFLKDKYAGLE